MLRLILDPIRRWWWVLTIVFLVAALSTLGGAPFLLAPAGVILLLVDAQEGLVRATAPLPVSRSAQARARWIFAVPFVVLLGTLAMITGAILREIVYPSTRGPGIEVVLQIALGFVSASLAFIGSSFARFRPAETPSEYLTQISVGLCWALSFTSLGWLPPWFLQHHPIYYPSYWNALAIAVPSLVGLSYFASEEFIRRQSLSQRRKASHPKRSQKNEIKGVVGVPLYLFSVPGRVIVLTLAMTSIQWITIRFISGHWTSYTNVGVFQFALFGIFISTFVTEQVSLRALRSLPLSAQRLTLLLLSGPCVSAAGIALLWIPEIFRQGLSPVSVWKISGMVILVAGCGALSLAIVLRYVGFGRVGVIFALAVTMPFAILFLPEIPGAAAAFGLLTGTAGYFLLYHSLETSSVVYQPRKLFGMGWGRSQSQ